MTNIEPTITVEITVKATVENVWKLWTTPADIMKWNNPSDDWHNLLVEADLKDEGRFLFRMQAKDGSEGFDYCGKYDKVKTNELIELTTSDGRKTINTFTPNGNETIVTETFEAETKTPIDIQRDFCQKVLNNFKKYAENKIK
ncbi:MAG: SRPBCC domain-containing protein [Segetibacter sp.]